MKKIVIEKNNKIITPRNYFIVLIIVLVTITLTLYTRAFVINYNNTKVSKSLFVSNVQSINISDLDYAIPETGEAIIYVSYTGNSSISSMEKTLYKEIENDSLNDKVIYLDITDYLEKNEYISILKAKFSNIKDEINTAPLFIYISDGTAIEAMSSELKMVNYKVFNKLVEEYGIE